MASKNNSQNVIQRYWKFGVLALIIVVAIYFIATYIIVLNIVSPEARHIDLSPVFISKDYQDASFTTSDNLNLKGWLFIPNAKKFVIFVPGILDNRTSGGYYGADLARELIAKNFGVLMYDPRARGDSEGTVRLQSEQEDVVGAVKFLESKNISLANIYVLSYSTGTRATLLAIPEIGNIGGVVVDSAPTDFREVLNNIVVNEQHLPGFISYGVYLWLDVYKISTGKDQILKNVADMTSPLLILQDQHDTSVPLINAQELHNANPKSKLVIFPNGTHIETYKFNPDMYRQVLFTFLGNSN